jgi:hypothetical protein
MYFYQIKCCFYTQNGCMNKKNITTVNSVTNTWSIQQTPMFHGCTITNKPSYFMYRVSREGKYCTTFLNQYSFICSKFYKLYKYNINISHNKTTVTSTLNVSIYSENRRAIYFSPPKRLKHGRQHITLHWINGIIRNNKCIYI